jgi:hypothetical protein
MSNAHTSAIVHNLLNHKNNSSLSIRRWLRQEGGAEDNLKDVIAALRAHPNKTEAKEAAAQLQSAIHGTLLGAKYNAIEMFSLSKSFSTGLFPQTTDGEEPVFVQKEDMDNDEPVLVQKEDTDDEDWDTCYI